MKDKGFIFYPSFYETSAYLPDDVKLKTLSYIIEYGLYGKEPTPDSSTSYAQFVLIKPQIDANTERRENGKKGAEYGKLGGRPKKPHTGNEENPIGVIDETPKDKEKEKDKDKDNVKEKDNGVLGEEEETLLPWERPITLTRQVGDLTKGLMRKTSL